MHVQVMVRPFSNLDPIFYFSLYVIHHLHLLIVLVKDNLLVNLHLILVKE